MLMRLKQKYNELRHSQTSGELMLVQDNESPLQNVVRHLWSYVKSIPLWILSTDLFYPFY